MRKLLLLPLLLLIPGAAKAQNITAVDCSPTGMTNAFAAVNAATAVITVPAGTCHWGNGSHVSFSTPPINTSLTVQGTTTCTGSGDPATNNLACTDGTIIIDDDTTDNNFLLNISGGASTFVHVTGMTFENGAAVFVNSALLTVSAGNNIRVDHNHFNGDTFTGGSQTDANLLEIGGCTAGVVDHNLFQMTGSERGDAVLAYNGASCNGDVNGQGNGAWAQATGFGSTSLVYVEQNFFDFLHNAGASAEADDCVLGGRAAFRFNTMWNGAHMLTHPTGNAANQRGCRAMEIYKNQFIFNTATTSPVPTLFFYSSGPALIWGNVAPNIGYQNFVEFQDCRSPSPTSRCGYGENTPPAGWGFCGSSSAWDQNSNGSGYACIDQVGRGQGDFIQGLFPNTVNTATGTITWPHQALEPVYMWLNHYAQFTNGNDNGFLGLLGNIWTANVDYYLSSNVNSSTDCNGFTGATGVGCGARSARPATCTTGVAWWSTDQGSWNTSGNGAGNGVLDKCTATNTWTNGSYTPLVYPHPLAGGPTPAVAPACIPAAGTYQAWTNVSCSTPSGTLMCFTTDGTTPTTNGTACTHGTAYATTPAGAPNPIVASTNETINIVAGATGLVDSPVTSQAYVITGDQYGGRNDTPCTNTTGVFTTVQIGNRWFFCTPQGHAFIAMMETMGLNDNLLDCNNAQQGDVNYLRLYGDKTFNWGWQNTARATHWGFNTAGQNGVSFVEGSTTCPSCVWPGHKQPHHLPYVIEPKPAENAAQNLSNIASGPIKEAVIGTNTHWQGFRGHAMFDVFDPGLAATWAAELASAADAPIKNNDPNVLYVLTDDSDFFVGAGASPDFILHVPGTTSENPAFTALITSPLQTSVAVTNVGAKQLVYPNPQNYTKTQALNPTAQCSVTTPCSLRDYLKQKYTTIGALNTAWGSSYTTFDSSATVVTSEAFGTGDGVTTTFTHTAATPNIDPFSIAVSTATVLQAGDCPWFILASSNPPVCFVAHNATNTGTFQTPTALNTATNENHTVPSGLIQTVNFSTINNSGTPYTIFDSNVSVKYHVGGATLTAVTGTPTTGQYNAGTAGNAGTYTFSAGDSGASLDFTYKYELINQPISTINYTTGAMTIAFTSPPANGAAITVSYQSNGWMQGGTGLMDEDGTNSAWVGTNTWCLEGPDPSFPTYSACVAGQRGVPNANPTLGADLDAWIPQFSGQFFGTIKSGLTAAGSHLLYFGLDVSGSYGAPAYSKFLQGATPFVDGLFQGSFQLAESASMAEWNSRLQYDTHYLGNKPFTMFNVSAADADSAYSCFLTSKPPIVNFPTQPARGQAWFDTINNLLNTTGANGTIQYVGSDWWAVQDFQSINQGLITPLGNAYDSIESVVGTVPCDSYYQVVPGATCGGELAAFNAPYGDVITKVTAANKLWLGNLSGSVVVSPTTEAFGNVNVGSQGTAQTATVTNFTTSSTQVTATSVVPGTGPAGDFFIVIGQNNCSGATLAANGGACTIQTNYAPTVTGAESATLNITITGGTTLPVAMSGTGVSTSNPVIAFTPTFFMFGNVVVNQNQNTNVVLKSAGTSALLISSITTSGAGFSQTNNCPASLAPNATCTIMATFSPTATGTASGNIVVIDNAPGSPQSVPLSGSGILVPTTSTGVIVQGSVVQ